MGRHSAPDDDEPDVEVEAQQTPAAASRPRPGRHSRPADVSGDDERPVEDEALTDPAGMAPVVAPEEDGRSRGRIGLGKPRPGGVPRAAAARSGPPPREPADDDTSPGIALIEHALAEDRSVPADVPEAREETVQITPIVDPVLDEPVPEAPTDKLRPVGDDDPPPAPAASDAPPPARVSDVALLRGDPAVRARVAAAVVVPFLLYVTVLLVLGSFDARTALIWIWIPLVTAGVVGGLILDLAHRAAAPRGDQRTSNPERTAP